MLHFLLPQYWWDNLFRYLDRDAHPIKLHLLIYWMPRFFIPYLFLVLYLKSFCFFAVQSLFYLLLWWPVICIFGLVILNNLNKSKIYWINKVTLSVELVPYSKGTAMVLNFFLNFNLLRLVKQWLILFFIVYFALYSSFCFYFFKNDATNVLLLQEFYQNGETWFYLDILTVLFMGLSFFLIFLCVFFYDLRFKRKKILFFILFN